MIVDVINGQLTMMMLMLMIMTLTFAHALWLSYDVIHREQIVLIRRTAVVIQKYIKLFGESYVTIAVYSCFCVYYVINVLIYTIFLLTL